MEKETIYELAKKSFGIVPGVIKEMAERSLPLAKLYTDGVLTMEESSLSNREINAIELKVSLLNKCESCIKGHTFLSKQAGISEEDIQALISNRATSDERLNKLLTATEYIYYSGSDTYPELVLDYFEMEQITETEVFEIIGLISLKTISNYVNNYLKSVKRQPVS
ncbi:MAG: carboxymuconolactone decarboxylase family protein [Bacteroidia bacterium]